MDVAVPESELRLDVLMQEIVRRVVLEPDQDPIVGHLHEVTVGKRRSWRQNGQREEAACDDLQRSLHAGRVSAA